MFLKAKYIIADPITLDLIYLHPLLGYTMQATEIGNLQERESDVNPNAKQFKWRISYSRLILSSISVASCIIIYYKDAGLQSNFACDMRPASTNASFKIPVTISHTAGIL